MRYPGEYEVISKSEFYMTIAIVFFAIAENLPEDDKVHAWAIITLTIVYFLKGNWEVWKAKWKSTADADASTTNTK